MQIIYYSLTGNVRRFLMKAECRNIVPMDQAGTPSEPFLMVTSTIGFGEIPAPVEQFLNQHHQAMIGVVASGNRNWGQNFARAGNRIAEKYHVPLLMKFELHGNAQDVSLFKEKVDELHENLGREKIQSH